MALTERKPWQHHRVGGTDWTGPQLRIVWGKEIGHHYANDNENEADDEAASTQAL